MTSDLDLLRMYSHDHSSHGIEGQGQTQRSRLGLGYQFGTRSVGPRSSIEGSFLVMDTVV